MPVTDLGQVAVAQAGLAVVVAVVVVGSAAAVGALVVWAVVVADKAGLATVGAVAAGLASALVFTWTAEH